MFLNERSKLNEQTQFFSTVFLYGEFELENIYSGVNFCGKIFAVIFICGNLFLRIAGKIAKLETAKRATYDLLQLTNV